jgi:hypothetical protein
MTGGMGLGVSLRGSNSEPLMSAMGQKQTLRLAHSMSALPPKADIVRYGGNVRKMSRYPIRPSARVRIHWSRYANRLSGPEVGNCRTA